MNLSVELALEQPAEGKADRFDFYMNIIGALLSRQSRKPPVMR